MVKGRRIIKGIAKTYGIAWAALILYFAVLAGTNTICQYRSPKISSQTQLQQLLYTEKKRLGCKKNIEAKLVNCDTAFASKPEVGLYRIVLGKGGANLSTLRHELYHIHDGHLDNTKKLFQSGFGQLMKYLFWDEPQAVIYEAVGLKP